MYIQAIKPLVWLIVVLLPAWLTGCNGNSAQHDPAGEHGGTVHGTLQLLLPVRDTTTHYVKLVLYEQQIDNTRNVLSRRGYFPVEQVSTDFSLPFDRNTISPGVNYVLLVTVARDSNGDELVTEAYYPGLDLEHPQALDLAIKPLPRQVETQ